MFGPAFQNLVDLINEKRYTGTLRELVGLEGAPRGTFADRNAPMYRLRRQRRVEIFNHAMRADPCNGSMHTLESLVRLYGSSRGNVSSNRTMHSYLQLW